MCRMILAMGNFLTQSVLNAAVQMSEGVTATHDNPLRRHPNGWGALWRDNSISGGLSVYRDIRSIKESVEQSSLHEIKTDFLVVHARHATLERNQKFECTHPITRKETAVPWYLFHNGFLPTIYQKLGLDHSTFDSGEYFDYIIPPEGDKLDPLEILEKLESLAPGGNSANAILVNPKRAYIIHWSPKDTRFPLYFTMYMLKTNSTTFIASEIISDLAPSECWSSLAREEILEFDLGVTKYE